MLEKLLHDAFMKGHIWTCANDGSGMEAAEEGFKEWYGGICRLIVHSDIHMVSEEKADELEARALKPFCAHSFHDPDGNGMKCIACGVTLADVMRDDLIAQGYPADKIGTVHPVNVRKRDLDVSGWTDERDAAFFDRMKRGTLINPEDNHD